jgi:hypothetical protein
MSAEARRARRDGAQRAARAHAERTRCPACARKSAMVRINAGAPDGLTVCRFCKHESTPATRAARPAPKGGTE